MRASHGWEFVDRERKREIIEAIRTGTSTSGPSHLELDLTDRCNVSCYFCNQQDLRTKDQIPTETIRDTIDSLAETGLRSVRLSGGGDPLFHRQIHDVLDHLISKGIIVDNLTTNGVAMTSEISEKLVTSNAREVIISLNAPNAEHYHRMLRVKPALFDKVLDNVRSLVEIRGDAPGPSIVIQFLLDRPSLQLLPESYELAASILRSQDRIAVGIVLPVRGVSVDESVLLTGKDADRAEPLLRDILTKDRERKLLQIDFPFAEWSALDQRLMAELDGQRQNLYPTASSFQDKNGGCFFAWYTAAVTGNGDVRPCCLLLNPAVKPLGNVHETPLNEMWHGERFTRMRHEMRDVLLRDSNVPHEAGEFQILERACTEAHLCWLKNMFFRGDEDFYNELGQALEEAREKELTQEPEPVYSWFGGLRSFKLRVRHTLHDKPRLHSAWKRATDSTRPLRSKIKKRLGVNLSEDV